MLRCALGVQRVRRNNADVRKVQKIRGPDTRVLLGTTHLAPHSRYPSQGPVPPVARHTRVGVPHRDGRDANRTGVSEHANKFRQEWRPTVSQGSYLQHRTGRARVCTGHFSAPLVTPNGSSGGFGINLKRKVAESTGKLR